MISTSDANEFVSAFYDYTVFNVAGHVQAHAQVWLGPAGLAIPPGANQDAGLVQLPIDLAHDHYSIRCEPIEWLGAPPV